MRFPSIALLILLWPLAEIAAFIFVGTRIGVLATIGLVILSGIVGSILMRVQGFATLRRIRAEVAAGRTPGRDLAHGLMILLAGSLLLLPGFVSDILGLLLFVPPIRDAVWRAISGRVHFVSNPSVFGRGFRRAGPAPNGGPTIDLDRDDYRAEPDDGSPWRRRIE